MNTKSKAVSMERSATISPCRMFRYALWRRWGSGPYAMFIGLNPSTADEQNDDPTIRRCIGFAQSWGYDALCMANLFAYRATKPTDMKNAANSLPLNGLFKGIGRINAYQHQNKEE
jgi:hypothetical protein